MRLANWLQSKPTISGLLEQYLSIKQLAGSTVEMTERAFGYLIDQVGDIRINRFEFAHVENFQGWILASGRNEVTANIYIKTIRPVFRWAVKRQLLANDPFKDLNLYRIPKGDIRLLESEEFEAIMKVCTDKIWKLRLLLAKTAALRRSEVLNLTVGDIDFAAGTIKVRKKESTHHTWPWQPKDKDSRTVPLAHHTAVLLSDIVSTLPDYQPYVTLKPERYDHLIEMHRAGLLPDRMMRVPDENFTKPLRKLMSLAGVDATFHDIRRTCITEWLESGLPPHAVMELAGHSSLETTMTHYVTTRRKQIDQARNISDANVTRGDRT